jgi:hypothetical protein
LKYVTFVASALLADAVLEVPFVAASRELHPPWRSSNVAAIDAMATYKVRPRRRDRVGEVSIEIPGRR